MAKTLSFEEKLKRVKAIQEILENTENPIDEGIKLYEEGQKLIKECIKYLSEVSLRIEQINQDENV